MLLVKPTRQEPGYCGPASLKMVLSYYGTEVTEKTLVDDTNCSPQQGVDITDLLRVLEKYGFSGSIKEYAEFSDIAHFISQGIPVIVEWFSNDDGHYSVVVDIDSENIRMIDPELGFVRAMKLDEFYRVWFDFPGNFISDKNTISLRRMLIVEPNQ